MPTSSSLAYLRGEKEIVVGRERKDQGNYVTAPDRMKRKADKVKEHWRQYYEDIKNER